MRPLEAMAVRADAETLLLVSGTGDLIAPDDGVLYAGSGGPYAGAAARALLRHSSLSLREICEASLRIAAEIDVYSNDRITVLECPPAASGGKDAR
jgi:ATP-dependent HslUV protease subunit HslV